MVIIDCFYFLAVEDQLSRKFDMSGVNFLESLHVLLPTYYMFANLVADFANPDLFVGTYVPIVGT